MADGAVIFHAIHSVAHTGIQATKGWYRHALSRGVWAKTRQPCAETANSANWERSTNSQQLHFTASMCGQTYSPHAHTVDLLGILLASPEGYMYLLTAIDKLTRCVIAVQLCNMEASPYTNTLATWVAGFGMPTTVTTDRGTQFTFSLWTSQR